MKIAIHHKKEGYSQAWIAYCVENDIAYKIVDAYATDIVEQVRDCTAFLWHHYHTDPKDVLAAKNVLFALQQAGVKVYPDFNTTWHFDDKVAQKYLLEAIDAPLVPSYVFYDKQKALKWLEKTSFPKVFKLKGGSGSSNVFLIPNAAIARKMINKAFGKGFSAFNRREYFQERWRKFKQGQDSLKGVLKGVGRLFIPTSLERFSSREKGYVYFQDFIPNNAYDIRIVVIGDKAIGERRKVRAGDFRASGSGTFDYQEIDSNTVSIAFEVAQKLMLQSVAFDFVLDHEKKPLIVELSYGFGTKGIRNAPGYWNRNLRFVTEKCSPEDWIIEGVIDELKTVNK